MQALIIIIYKMQITTKIQPLSTNLTTFKIIIHISFRASKNDSLLEFPFKLLFTHSMKPKLIKN